MKDSSPVLVSWVAQIHDPFDTKGLESQQALLGQDSEVPGPTLMLLFDKDSCFCGKIRDVVLLRNKTTDLEPFKRTKAEILKRSSTMVVGEEVWPGEKPTDHKEILEFVQGAIARIRKKFPTRELVIHVSPGAPTMQTVWVLMGTTGMIPPPMRLVQSTRRSERKPGDHAVVGVNLEIETFFKVYQRSRPATAAAGTSDVGAFWDNSRFQSKALRSVFDEAERFARVNVPVLITGERGTGKTSLANWIRSNSPFRSAKLDDDWPAVACGQYTPELMRAELFGYVKGAFTGAVANSDGLLKKAHGDTLFLDEIGDMPPLLQRLLIKALEDKRFQRLGDTKFEDSNFRLISATNKPLNELREQLAPDFLDRVAVITLRMPALREICEDIPWLWAEVLSKAAERAGVVEFPQAEYATDTRLVNEFARHPLPGNIRDLYRVAYRLLAAAGEPERPMPAEATIPYALLALQSHDAGESTGTDNLARKVAHAFAAGEPLDSAWPSGSPVDTSVILSEFRHYLASSVREIGRRTGRKGKDLCDVTDRTLRDWTRLGRQTPSNDRLPGDTVRRCGTRREE